MHFRWPDPFLSLITPIGSGRLDWTDYYDHTEINEWMATLAAANSGVAKVVNIGTSFEGRNMDVMVVGKDAANPNAWIDAGIHSREWIAPAVATYMINELVTNPKYDSIVSNLNIHILPSANPDGYTYSITDVSQSSTVQSTLKIIIKFKERMWRKTRKPNAGSTCYGTDPNRNFGYHWSGAY